VDVGGVNEFHGERFNRLWQVRIYSHKRAQPCE
jgi:hypothetical protein